MNAGGRFRQDERFANFKLLDHERPAFEKLHAGLEYQINKSRGRENNVVLDFVILEESHVPAIEPRGPGGRRARQPHVEHSAAARARRPSRQSGASFHQRLAIPSICRQRKQTTRWRHRLEIERRACAMQIHGGFQQQTRVRVPGEQKKLQSVSIRHGWRDIPAIE